MNPSLIEIFDEIGHFGPDVGCNDKNSTHHYLPTYDTLLLPYRDGSTILEIGLALGDSIKLWDRYFDNSHIIGADISLVFKPPPYRNTVTLLEADATKYDFVKHFEDESLDVVIDDGDHQEASQIVTFNLLKPKMKKGSIYIIEDILALNQNKHRFEALHDNCEIIDLRHIAGRFDDVLILYRF